MRDPMDFDSKVIAADGEVRLDCFGLNLSLSPSVATELAKQLYEAAAKARGQQLIEENDAALQARRSGGGGADE